jgi:hypothetical protein
LTLGNPGIKQFWETSIDSDGSVFGDGKGKRVLNLVFEILWPVSGPVGVEVRVRALLKLVERVRGLKVGSEEMREVFGFRDDNGDGGREVR